MDTFKTLLEWLKTLPIWLRAIALALIAGLALIASISLSACGSTTRATVRNNAEGTQTEVKITTSNPSTIQVSPNVTLTPKQ